MKGFVISLLMLLVTSIAYGETPVKQEPSTLIKMSGFKLEPSRLSNSVIVVIDAQREYLDGKLPLHDMEASAKEGSLLLDRARKAGTPIVHIVQKSKTGSVLFNPEGKNANIIDAFSPKGNETIVTKSLPNAFAGTNLEETLARLGRKNLIVIGYMTHMCVSSTVRGAVDRGYRNTVVAKATATRDLPRPGGGVVAAEAVQSASLAALADRFAAVVQSTQDIPD